MFYHCHLASVARLLPHGLKKCIGAIRCERARTEPPSCCELGPTRSIQAAASHSGNSMFAVDAAASVTTSLICNCESEVVPLQTSHSMLPPPPPPPSFAPARLRWYPLNIHMQCFHHCHQHHPRRQKGGGPPTLTFALSCCCHYVRDLGIMHTLKIAYEEVVLGIYS